MPGPGGSRKGIPNKRTAAIRKAMAEGKPPPSASKFDSLEQQRKVAKYFLAEAEKEQGKGAKANKKAIAENLDYAARVLKDITPFERPRLTAMKVSGGLNLTDLTDSELAFLRRLAIKMGLTGTPE